ncbi:hypothetical protein [Rothia nasimurium]|nr:hypothetical protein [Rothia nasimurium]
MNEEIRNYHDEYRDYYKQDEDLLKRRDLLEKYSYPVIELEKHIRFMVDKTMQRYCKEHGMDMPWTVANDLPIAKTTSAKIESARKSLSFPDNNNHQKILDNISLDTWACLASNSNKGSLDGVSNVEREFWREWFSGNVRDAKYDGDQDKDQLRKRLNDCLEEFRNFRNDLFHFARFESPEQLSNYEKRAFQLAEMLKPGLGYDLFRGNDNLSVEARENDSRIGPGISLDIPKVGESTVIVAANVAYEIFMKCQQELKGVGFYVCPSGRSFRRDTKFMAFYADRSIKPEIAEIISIRDYLPWNKENIRFLNDSQDPIDKQFGKCLEWALSDEGERIAQGWAWDEYKVFLLKIYPDNSNVLESEIPHLRQGVGSAFTMSKRYTTKEILESASTTDDLL